jgi:flagellin
MSLGVLNNLSAVYAENNVSNTNNQLSKTLQQLSSGSRINSGADDAAGLSLVDGLQANQTALNQSETNSSEGVGLLQVADGALSQVTSLLNRAVTLATEDSNGTLNSSQDSAANQEYQSILSEITNIGSTTTYNQNQVFNSVTAIYTGDSTQAGSSIDSLSISALSSANLGDTNGTMSYTNGASNVFIDLSKNGSNAALTDSLNASGTTSLQVNYVTAGSNGSSVNASATITVGTGTSYSNTVSGMINAINNSGLGLHATLGTAAQAGTGAAADALAANTTNTSLTSAQDTGIIIAGAGVGTGSNDAGEIGKFTVAALGDALTGTLSVVSSDGKTHQITLGTANSTDNITNLANTINGAGYGITATVSGTSLEFTSASAAASVSSAVLKDAGTQIYLTNQPSTSAGQTLIGDVTVGATNAGDTLTIGSTVYTMTAGESITTIATAINKNTQTTGISAVVDPNNAGHLQIFSSNGAAGTNPGTNQWVTSSTAARLTVNTGTADQLGEFAGTGTAGTLVVGSNSYTMIGTAGALAALVNANTATTGISMVQQGASGNYFLVNDLGQNNVTVTDAAEAGMTTAVVNSQAQDNWGTTAAFYTTKVSQTAAGISDSATAGGSANTSLGSDVNGTTGIATISYSHGAGQSLSTTDLSNASDAQTALTELNIAIADVAAQDGYIGAQINTLNAVSNVLSTQAENVQAAQNAVQATDYAQASSNMSKYEILSQTGISALAQANSLQQEVLKLLQ